MLKKRTSFSSSDIKLHLANNAISVGTVSLILHRQKIILVRANTMLLIMITQCQYLSIFVDAGSHFFKSSGNSNK